jgi:hypothetical protein
MMEPKYKVRREGIPEILMLADQKLTAIIDKRTELSMMIDELWEILDQIKNRLPDDLMVLELRGYLLTEQDYLDTMDLERIDSMFDTLRSKYGWGVGNE